MAIVPTHSDLASIYGLSGTADAMARYASLAEGFKERYGGAPTVFARAPGRVNLIGEHIDYEGYGVLPIAINRDVVVAARLNGTALTVSNHDESPFPAYSFVADPTQLVDTANHVWANYALAAYKGVHEFLDAHPEALTPLSKAHQGIELLVHGSVPTGSGLSSSSALVVAVATAIIAVYGCTVGQEDLASFTCSCERFVGVNSGGMDQAISVMAQQGEGSYVEFNPVRSTKVPLPTAGAFVVANSLAISNKQESAVGCYNLRVVECRLAAVMLAIALGSPQDHAVQLTSLKECEDIVRLYFLSGDQNSQELPGGVRPPKKVQLPEDVRLLDRCEEAARTYLQEEPYTSSQIQKAIGKDLVDLFPDFPSAYASIEHASAEGGFALQKRAMHVFSEAARVLRFRNICLSSDSDELKLMTLGGLMRKSHESCRDRYDCSCQELEDVVLAGKRAGALGSRLTGAGWGGCSVHLVRDRDVDKFVSALERDFYARRRAQLGQSDVPSDVHVFATQPAQGAAIVTTAAVSM